MFKYHAYPNLTLWERFKSEARYDTLQLYFNQWSVVNEDANMLTKLLNPPYESSDFEPLNRKLS